MIWREFPKSTITNVVEPKRLPDKFDQSLPAGDLYPALMRTLIGSFTVLIASLDAAADKEGISRSELIERYGRNYQLIEAVLDAVEAVLYDATSTEECLSPHPSYEVDGDVIRRLSGAFMALMNEMR